MKYTDEELLKGIGYLKDIDQCVPIPKDGTLLHRVCEEVFHMLQDVGYMKSISNILKENLVW